MYLYCIWFNSIKNGFKNNIYFNLLGLLFRYEFIVFYSVVMLLVLKFVVLYCCMILRKNVFLLNKGFVNICIRYL